MSETTARKLCFRAEVIQGKQKCTVRKKVKPQRENFGFRAGSFKVNKSLLYPAILQLTQHIIRFAIT